MCQGNTGGIRRIARWRLGETQEVNDHEGDLLLLGIAVADHCGFDLGRSVWVDGNIDATEGSEKDPATLGEHEARFGVAPAESGFHRGTVGSELGDDGGEPSIEIRQSHRVVGSLWPHDPERLEAGPIPLNDNQRPPGGSGSRVDA